MCELLLLDGSSTIGKIYIQASDSMVLGDFIRFAGYEKYAKLFETYEEAAGNQELVEIDRLDTIIASFNFRVTDPDGSNLRFVRSVQITTSGISFRWK